MNGSLKTIADNIHNLCTQNSENEARYRRLLHDKQLTIIDELGGMEQIVTLTEKPKSV